MAEETNAKLAQALAAKDAELKAFRENMAVATTATLVPSTGAGETGDALDSLYAEHQWPGNK